MKRTVLTVIFFAASVGLALGQTHTKIKTMPSSNSVYEINHGFVDADGVMIYYEEFGRGEPLMIVHGGPGASHDYFLPYLIPLARHNRLIFIDERGSVVQKNLKILLSILSKTWSRMWKQFERRWALARCPFSDIRTAVFLHRLTR